MGNTAKRWTHHSTDEGSRYTRHFWTRWRSNDDPNDPTDEKEIGGFSYEALWLKKGHGFSVQLNVDTWDTKIHVGLGRLYQGWFKAERWRPVLWLGRTVLPVCPGTHPATGRPWTHREERELSISLHDGLLSWTAWYEPNVWKRDEWRTGMWNWKGWLTGKHACTFETLESGTTQVPMPEGPYEARWEIQRRTDSWQRFKRPKVSTCGEIEVPGGIYVPGKGENSWDCGDDAIFSISCHEATVEALVAQYVKSVYRSRLRYAGTLAAPVG